MDMSISFCHETAVGEEANTADIAGFGDSAVVLRDCLVEHYGSLHRRLASHLGCPELASECLHDAWLRLGDIAKPTCVRSPVAYVYRIARNLAIDRLRGDNRTMALADMSSEASLSDLQPGPAQTAEARSMLAHLDQALLGLPVRHRCVLFDLRIDGRTRAQVAATYGLSVRGVDTLLRQALDQCAAAMRACEASACRPLEA